MLAFHCLHYYRASSETGLSDPHWTSFGDRWWPSTLTSQHSVLKALLSSSSIWDSTVAPLGVVFRNRSMLLELFHL